MDIAVLAPFLNTILMHSVDILIPTYNRADMLRRTLTSIVEADDVLTDRVKVYVVDNNCTDDTQKVIAEFAEAHANLFTRVHGVLQGRSAALNSGIAAGTGELIAMIDDDERIARNWIAEIQRIFSDKELDFAGGPYRGDWVVEPPVWLPTGYPSVIGQIDWQASEIEFSPTSPVMMMGGNAVLRRSILEKIGTYNEGLGRGASGLASGEDDDMYQRLLRRGFRGRYFPTLVIYHYIAPSRLTKEYHRRWVLDHARSMGKLAATSNTEAGTLLGIPHYSYREVAVEIGRQVGKMLTVRSNPAERFGCELKLLGLWGRVMGYREADAKR